MSTIIPVLVKAAWIFWALGPQLALCLWLSYSLARRRRESRLSWMLGGFLASLVPVVGAVAMYLLWRPGRKRTAAVP